MATTKRHDVKDLALAPEGIRRIGWADRQMPVLQAIRERFEREPALHGAVATWLAGTQLSALDWEQRKHERLLVA